MKCFLFENDYFSMGIGNRIKLARRDKGFSQQQLANMVSVSKSACGQWERGTTKPSVENLSQLAIVLDVHFEWLATGRGDMAYPQSSKKFKTGR